MNPQPATIMTGGLFGPGFLCCQAISGGVGWTMIGDEKRLVYVDGAAGNFDDLMPCHIEDAASSSIVLANQDLAPAFTDTDCKLLLRFDGADGATAVIDSSPTTKIVAAAGAFALDDAQKKFGATSGYFTTVGDVLTVTDHDGFALGAAWTIEGWVKWSSITDLYLWRQYVDISHFFTINVAAAILTVQLNIGSGTISCSHVLPAGTLTDGQWHHIAVTFDGTNCRLFCDGALLATDTDAYTLGNFAADPTINYGGGFRGLLDEFSLWSVCKYDAAFTPPTQPYGVDDTQVWQFKQAGVSPGGSIGDLSDALAVEVDSTGQVVGPVGNNASNLTATPLAGGTIKLDWQYDRTDEPATPTGFKVYRKVASVWTLQETVALSANRLRYDANVSQQTWTSGAFGHGTVTQWQVRTYKTIGGTDYERLADAPEASATADAQGPAAVTGLTLGVPG